MIAQNEVPQSQAAVAEVIDDERRKVRDWAERSFREIEAERDAALAKLDAALAAVNGGTAPVLPAAPADPPPAPAPAPAPSAAKPKPKGRRGGQNKGTKQPTSAEIAARRERVYDFIAECGGKVKPKAVRDALDINEHAMRKAIVALIEEGRIRKIGERQFTEYEAITTAGSSTPPLPAGTPPMPSPPPATISGRILMLAEERQGISLADLTAEIGQPEAEIREECGKLIAEEELRMTKKNGQSVYVVEGS